MKLLIGGSSSKLFHLKEFASMLEKYGIETKVVFDADYSNGFPNRKISQWFLNSNKFKKLINEFKPDAVFVDRQRHFGIDTIKTKIPLLVHLRGDFWAEIEMAKNTLYKSLPKKIAINKWEEIGQQCFQDSKIILPICNYLKQRTLEYFPEKNVEVLYQGINPKNWYQQKGMKLNHPCVGLVQSATIWEKAKEMLQLTHVMKKFPNVTFYWAGDGVYRDNILPELEKFDNFKWLGSLEYPNKVREFLSEIDVYALISGIDMSPLTLLEAQLMEKPVIATSVGGIPELMLDNKTGFLIKKGDSKDLEGKISAIIDNKNKEEMGIQGRKFVEDNFEWSEIAKKFSELMDKYL